MVNLRIVYFGHNQRGADCLTYLTRKGIIPVCIVTQESAAKNASSRLMYLLAKKYAIPYFCVKNPNNESFVARLKKFSADIFLLAGSTVIFRPHLLALPKVMTLNLHGGKLPDFRGASVLNWQIISGAPKIGISIIEVDKGVDTGAILSQRNFNLRNDQDINHAYALAYKLFPVMLEKVLRDISNGELKKIPQDPKQGKRYFKRHPEDGKIDWTAMKAREIVNLVRAVAPPACPGAFAFRSKEKIIITHARFLNNNTDRPCGSVGQLRTLRGFRGRIVAARDGEILIKSSPALRPGDHLR